MAISVTDPISRAIARAKLITFQPFDIGKWFLPYLNCVVALPLLVFSRAYGIYFLQQFGPQYVIINEPPMDYGFPVMMATPMPMPPPVNEPPIAGS